MSVRSCGSKQEIEDRLSFNAHWGLTRLPADIRRDRDAALVDSILSVTGLAGRA